MIMIFYMINHTNHLRYGSKLYVFLWILTKINDVSDMK